MRTSSRRRTLYTYIANENDSDHIFEYCTSAAETAAAANKFYINASYYNSVCMHFIFFFFFFKISFANFRPTTLLRQLTMTKQS